jgi:hypothetical protein
VPQAKRFERHLPNTVNFIAFAKKQATSKQLVGKLRSLDDRQPNKGQQA